MARPKLIIAGPGAGKTYNMVQTIITKLPQLNSSRYMVVITYTNSAAENIRNRLSKKINIPKNIFIGTIHSFVNKFIVIPYSSLNSDSIGAEKLFIQCDIDNVFETVKKNNGKTYNVKQAAYTKAKIKEALNKKGYISFDQSVSIAKECLDKPEISKIISNRLQFLFVDEFQDTNNSILHIIDKIRKNNLTEIYCVGDPEQFIQSFDFTSKVFENIPILKTSINTKFDIELNRSNYRCSESIVTFINNFNSRSFNNEIFFQESKTGIVGERVKFISTTTSAKDIIDAFNNYCSSLQITPNKRCVISKKNDTVNRIISAINGNYRVPTKTVNNSPIKTIIDTFLSALQLNQTEYLKKYNCDIIELRKIGIKILKEIKNGTITNENTFANYITSLGFSLNAGIPIKIENIRLHLQNENPNEAIMVSNIHNIKGLESSAVLALAKTHAELQLWIETDRTVRETYRDKEITDYPRLGYVAFSRAKDFLSIACLEPITDSTREKLILLGVEIV